MPEITEYNWIASDVYNAYYTGCESEQIVGSFTMSNNIEELSAALDALVDLKDLVDEYYGTPR